MIVLLGSTGYVGSHFKQELQRRGIPMRGLSRAEVDYTRPEALRPLLHELKPRYLINAAGYTGKPTVDACERDKAACLDGNASFPGRLAQLCGELELPWGHVSSGCIYTGRRADGAGFTEEDTPNFSFRAPPCSWYSGTKALGEEILADAPNCTTWRLRIPFGEVDSPRNYLSKLRTYEWLIDVENAISHVADFVNACLDCIEQEVAPGIYNVTNPGAVTARQVVDMLMQHKLLANEPKWVPLDEFYQRIAITPRSNCVLDSSKLLRAGIHIRPVEEALEHSMSHWTEALGSPA